MTAPSSGAIYPLTILGTLAPPTLEAARTLHNETAGKPESVAAAQSLGDLSHMVYVPAEGDEGGKRVFFILDLWNDLGGLNQFFANPQVQEEAGRIFTTRDPVVWAPADGFFTYHLPAPTGKNDRFLGVLRGTVTSREQVRAAINATAMTHINTARKLEQLSHEVYFRLSPPDAPESLELLALDTWTNLAGMQEHYSHPDYIKNFDGIFTAQPWTALMKHPAGEWVQW